MIIQCENCETKFDLDPSRIKPEGSKVRCAVCKHVFVVSPLPEAPPAEAETIALSQGELDALAQDLPSDFTDGAQGDGAESESVDFEEAFSQSMDNLDQGDMAFLEPEPEPEPEVVEEKPRKGLFSRGKRKAEKKQAAPPPEEIEDVEEMDLDEAEAEAAPSPPKREKARKTGVLPIILVIILLVIGGGVAVFFFAPDLIPDSLSFLKPVKKQQAQDMGVRRLSFKAVTGAFVDSQGAGTLFVVRGVVRNGYPKPRSFILIRASILDDQGKVVKRRLAYAANTFNDEELRVKTLEAINKALKNRQGAGKKNTNVAPGANTPFMVVFENLPDNLSEFTVEAVSSSPGSR